MLPIQYPPITSYQHHAATLSIMAAHGDDLPWFCSNYIQLRVNVNPDSRPWLDFFSFLYQEFHNCPYLRVQHLESELITELCPDVAEFAVRSLRIGYYVYAVIDCALVPAYADYGKEAAPHPILLYGCDTERELLYAGDFFRGRFAWETIGFEDFRSAFRAVKPGGFNFVGAKLIQPYVQIRYELDLETVGALFADYLYGRETEERYRMDRNLNPDIRKGLDAVYDRLVQEVERHLDEPEVFHLTSFHVLHDHKRALVRIIGYLQERGHLERDYGFAALETAALALRNTILKYSLRPSPKLRDQILRMLEALREAERSALTALLAEWPQAPA
ncbi:hypothetical protein B5M42_004155 [Paenibacillus athensensis]|nr:hypothetical protein [Paenibacillus athensensis]MCD1258030.1 hypothetical protein [Paenibacillus athensensis]